MWHKPAWVAIVTVALAAALRPGRIGAAEQLVHGGRPITLGETIEATELFVVRDVKFRMGKYLDGKLAVVGSGLIETTAPTALGVGLGISVETYVLGVNSLAFRDGERLVSRLVPLAALAGTLPPIEPGKPVKFYVAGDSRPLGRDRKMPEPSVGLVYCVSVKPMSAAAEAAASPAPGKTPDEFVHGNKPITLSGAVAAGTPWFAVRDVKLQTGTFLDGRRALVASGRVEARFPVLDAKLRGSTNVRLTACVLCDDGQSPPLVEVAGFASAAEMDAGGKTGKFTSVGILRDVRDRKLPDPPARLYYYSSVLP